MNRIKCANSFNNGLAYRSVTSTSTVERHRKEPHLFRYGNWLVYQHGCKRRMEPTTTHHPQPFLMTRHVRNTRASSHVEQGRLDPSHVERHRVTWNKAASIQATWNEKWPFVRFDTSHAQQEGPFSQTALTKATQRSPLCIHQHLYTRI